MGRYSDAIMKSMSEPAADAAPAAGRYSSAIMGQMFSPTPEPVAAPVSAPVDAAPSADPGSTIGDRPRDPGGIIPPTEEPSISEFIAGARVRAGKGFMNIGQGLKQVGLEAFEKAGYLDEGASEQYTKLTDKQRADFDKEFENKFGDSFFWDALEFTAEVAPGAVMGGIVTRAPAIGEQLANLGFRARTALQAGTAAASGGSVYVEEGGSRVTNAAIGGAVGGSASTVIERLGALKNMVSNSLRRVLAGSPRGLDITGRRAWRELSGMETDALTRSRESVRDGLELFDRVSNTTGKKVPITVMQLTDDPAAMGAYALSQMSEKGQRIANEASRQQLEAGVVMWNRVIDRIEPGIERVGEQVQKAFSRVMGLGDNADTGLLQFRKNQAARDFTRVESLAPGTQIPINTLRAHVSKIIAENLNVPGTGPKRVVREMQGYLQDLGGRNTMPVREFQKLMSNLGDAAQGRGRILSEKVDPTQNKTIAQFLFSGLSKDLESPALIGGASAFRQQAAKNALLRARSNYKRATDQISEVSNSAIGKVFNIRPGEVITADAVEKSLLRMGADDTRRAIEILETADPAMSARMRALWLSTKFNEAQQAGQFNKVEFSPGRMFDIVRKDDKFEVLFPEGSVDREMVSDAFDFMRRIIGNRAFSAPSGALPRLKEGAGLAGGAASGQLSPIFLGRYLAPILFASRIWPMEQVLTRTGIEEVMQQTGRQGPALATAIAGGAAAASPTVTEGDVAR